MKTEEEIRKQIELFEQMKGEVLKMGMRENALSYYDKIKALEWVLEDSDE